MGAPKIACCDPVRKPFPSGYAWAHRRSCPVGRGQKLGNEPRRGRPEPGSNGGVDSWLDHDVACTCYDCSYVNAHLDDEREDA